MNGWSTLESCHSAVIQLSPVIGSYVPTADGYIVLCLGEASAETLRWLDQIESYLEAGYLPEAFHEYTTDYSRWLLIRSDGKPNSSIAPLPSYIRPGEEKGVLHEPFWKTAKERLDALLRAQFVPIYTSALRDDSFCFDLAQLLRQAMGEAGKFEAVEVLRATVGALLDYSDAHPGNYEAQQLLPISLSSPSELVAKRAGRLLSMVHELHKVGYQRLRICAGRSHDGAEWRCALVTADNVYADGWRPRDFSLCQIYSSKEEKNFFGWTDAGGDDARKLAVKFLERFPDAAKAAAGPDWAYSGWFANVLGAAENVDCLSFMRGVDLHLPADIIMPPPPIGFEFKTFSFGSNYHLIGNDDLEEGNLPRMGADYQELSEFCLSYDGYAGGLRTITDCFEIADAAEQKGLHNCSIDELRITAFIRQRTAKNNDLCPPPKKLIEAMRAAIEEIRNRISAHCGCLGRNKTAQR